jgi:predicted RNase H-like HicB family nuclease
MSVSVTGTLPLTMLKYRMLSSSELWIHFMTYRILLRKQPSDGYVATALGWPGCQVTAPTRDEALSQIQAAITDMLVADEIVDLDIPAPLIPAPYAETFGMFRDDPTFAEFETEVERYRQDQNKASID